MDSEVNTFKQTFEEELSKLEIRDNSSLIKSEVEYNNLVKLIQEAKVNGKKSSADYRRLKRYDILRIDGIDRLISPVTKNGDESDSEVKYFIHNGELFDVLIKAHTQSGHGGFHKMLNAVRMKYVNISRPAILLFLKLCVTCVRKRAHPRRGLVVKPIISKEANARAQVDLIDLQSCNDKDFKFILNYQDHLTKFSVLRALRSKRAAEVAYHLIDIFTLFGAPSILQSDNGREFVNCIIDELLIMWPDLKIVHGKPRHSQSQGSVERSNQDVGQMIRAWMHDNNRQDWSEGLRFCQYHKNNSLHSTINQSPFEALFGRRAKLGIASSSLPDCVINSLRTEEDLQNLQEEEMASSNLEDIDTNLEESTENDVAGILVTNKENITRRQLEAVEGMEKQAKRMRLESDRRFAPLEIKSCVTIPIPDVDRSKADFRNIIGIKNGVNCIIRNITLTKILFSGVVMEVTEDNLYKIGTKEGILPQLYSRNQISFSDTQFLQIEEVPNQTISLREANTKESIVGGQGFTRCGCTTKCKSNRCKCRKKGQLCNSRCHNSLNCCNK